jgi:integrative and conjugative element protein (TIGR02256 family)
VRARDERVAPGRLWLATDALDAMVAEARHKEPLESGGVLLGWRDTAGTELVVAGVLGPGPGATHRRTKFSPDTNWQRKKIAAAYETSGRKVSYLGDWHSHPGGDATPSRRDERTARRIARSRSARAPGPVMLILSGRDDLWRSVPYQFIDKRLQRMDLARTGHSRPAGESAMPPPWPGACSEHDEFPRELR